MSNHLVTRTDLSTFKLLEVNPHARKQILSRNIRETWVNVVAAYGGWNLSYRIALFGTEEIFQVSNPSKLIRTDLGIEVDNDELRDLCKLVIVASPDGRRMITAYHEE